MSIVADSPSRAREFFDRLKSGSARIEQRYRDLTPRSRQLAADATSVLPGGCTRQGVFREPYPVYVDGAEGSVMMDADGRALVDFCFDATALPLGHAHPAVTAAVARQLPRGTALFSPTAAEIALAREICHRLPCAERVAFATSGGEAVMTAIRVARAYTGRRAVAKFEGSFHGSHDDVIWSVAPTAGSAGAAHAPSLARVSEGVPDPDGRVVVLPYNDPEATVALIDAHAATLAAVIVEPLANRMGLVTAHRDFIAAVRHACTRHGIVLIFDEVLCFRVGRGGMQERLGVLPDLTTLGKVIGGGFPVGAVAGRADIMELLDPRRAPHVYHTGTFAANPVTLVAGLATLEVLTPVVFQDLNRAGERLRSQLRQMCDGLPLQVTGEGSLFKISATAMPLENYRSTLTIDAAWQTVASMALMNEGFFFTTQLHGCIATTTTPEQIDGFLSAFAALVQR